MESVFKMIRQTEKSSGSEESERQLDLVNEIREVCRQLNCTERWFQMEKDDDLIEACIHQREVLNARYRYLMRKAKRDNLYSSPFERKCL